VLLHDRERSAALGQAIRQLGATWMIGREMAAGVISYEIKNIISCL
jgi:hypothetical protein